MNEIHIVHSTLVALLACLVNVCQRNYAGELNIHAVAQHNVNILSSLLTTNKMGTQCHSPLRRRALELATKTTGAILTKSKIQIGNISKFKTKRTLAAINAYIIFMDDLEWWWW